MGRAFEGLKVLGFTYAGTANMVMRVLGMYGATVIRVESETRPCNLRSGAPYRDDKPGLNRSGYYAMYNNDRYSLGLNLKHPKAKKVLDRLCGWADVFVENFTPGTLDRLGLGYETLKKIRPDIIYLSISGQGQTGPHHFMPSYGPQMQALTGHVNLCGWPDRGPCQVDQSYPDFIIPAYATITLIGALYHRKKTGKGQYLDASNLEPAVSWLAPVMLDYTVNRNVQTRCGNASPSAAPHNAYPCQGEDYWCAIAVTSDEEWRNFCKAIGKAELATDPRFATIRARKENEAELDRIVGSWTANFKAEEVMRKLQAAGVPAGKVNKIKDAVDDPQLRYRNYYVPIQHSEIGEYEVLNTGYKLSRTPAEVRLPFPCLGEHSELVCREMLKMSDEEFLDLLTNDVLK